MSIKNILYNIFFRKRNICQLKIWEIFQYPYLGQEMWAGHDAICWQSNITKLRNWPSTPRKNPHVCKALAELELGSKGGDERAVLAELDLKEAGSPSLPLGKWNRPAWGYAPKKCRWVTLAVCGSPTFCMYPHTCENVFCCGSI